MSGYGPNGQYIPASGLENPVVFERKDEMPAARQAHGLGKGRLPRRTFTTSPNNEVWRVKES